MYRRDLLKNKEMASCIKADQSSVFISSINDINFIWDQNYNSLKAEFEAYKLATEKRMMTLKQSLKTLIVQPNVWDEKVQTCYDL